MTPRVPRAFARHTPRSASTRRRYLAFGKLLVVLAGLLPVQLLADATREYEVKAAFLYNFTKFIEWPGARFSAPDEPVVIAVLGRSPFGDGLAAAVAGRLAAGRGIVVQPALTAAEARAAHILFVPAGEEGRFAAIASDLTGAGVTTVGESDRFAAQGGIITFVQEAGRVRFAINLEAAERAGLKVSAQLLRLATHVRR